MPREKQKPTETTGRLDEIVRRHPAFGSIGAFRIESSGGQRLFGSPTLSRGCVRIEIHNAEEAVSFHHDRRHVNTTSICEIELSEAQWATFVSTMNVGTGVPCTLRHKPAEPYILQLCPEIDEPDWRTQRRSDIRMQVKESMAQLQAAVTELDAVLKQPKVSKKDLEKVRINLMKAIEHAPSNYEFAGELLNEHVEDLVTHAKAEVGAFVTRMAMQFPALEKVAPELPLIEKKTNEDKTS